MQAIRDRLSRVSKQRIGRAIGLLLFVAFSMGAAVYLLGRVGTHLLPQAKQYYFEADVQDAVDLAKAADVREAGIKIGQVNQIKQSGTLAALQISIAAKYGPVYRDATVLIRSKSIAAEKYVQLDPGNPRTGALPSYGVLPVSHELQPVQDDDVFSMLDKPERDNLQRALGGTGRGLTGQGGANLNRTLGAMTAVVGEGSGLAQTLAAERSQTANLVNSFDTVASALGSRASDIQTLTRAALTTAQAVSTRNTQLQATLAALPSFLQQAEVTSQRLGTFSLDATPVMSNLRIAAQALVPAVQVLRPASIKANTTLATLDRFAQIALPTVRQLRPFAARTQAFVAPYSSAVRQLDPITAYMNRYWRELSTWFADDGAAVQASDSIGHVARVIVPVSRSNYPTVVTGPEAAILNQFLPGQDTRGTNAYPAPGAADKPGPLLQQIPPLQPDPPYVRRAPSR